ncbi:translational activator of cytochrome c oxidase 1 [Cephus cinctus]|uniref:Translational activator of cytochrome c oxidase 1 n=1 Tax=Cephus cinctus TaxID=211228 RepID=A0AAJ7BYT7_CEPCN|nr:translational activator of cytochrome c oxidase 1 [Cephus cinctus]
MNKVLNTLIYKRTSRVLWQESKRFAGHSKWANIKHIKGQKDAEKSSLYLQYTRRMKIAIAESGGIADPEKNLKLLQIIEQAKKSNMPLSSINNFLKKQEMAKQNTQSSTVDIRGPAGSIVIIELLTDNISRAKNDMNVYIKKFKMSLADHTAKNNFDHKGIVITNLLNDIDTATEHAIQAGAEDVQEVENEDKKYYQFTCDPVLLQKVQGVLSNLNYQILSADEEYVPKIQVTLNENDRSHVEKFVTKIRTSEEVVKVHDNIA